MSAGAVLVIGATGTVGGPVARQLLADGYHVRLLVRDVERAQMQLGPGFEYLSGRVESADAVKRALSGCSGVHISLDAGSNPEDIERVEHRGAVGIIDHASKQQRIHVSYVSGMFVGQESRGGVLADQAKVQVERALQASGLPFTIFRPTYFMDNLPKHLQGKRAMLLGRQPNRLHLAAADDFGRMVSRAFRTPEAASKIFYVHGPEALTLTDALSLYCSVLEPGARVMTVPLWAMSIVDSLFLRKRMRRIIQMMAVLQRRGEIGDASEANRVLGAPTTTLESWCAQQSARRSTPDDVISTM